MIESEDIGIRVVSSSFVILILLGGRVKQLKEEPYTQKTAEAAVGLWTDNKGPQKKESADVEMA